MDKKLFIFIPFALWLIYVIFLSAFYPEVRWDWEKEEAKPMSFPDGFVWGVATAAHQVEGGCTNNWSAWENSTDDNNNPRIHNDEKSGIACDHWNRYQDDIQLIKDLGVTSYRFSIEWSKVEPEEGQFDSTALEHYKDVCIALKESGITPVVTLHHFTHPIWFEEKGAFENKENLSYFVRYSERVFDTLKDYVGLWCTINEPAVYTYQGYFNGVWPPGKIDPQLAGKVLKNLLEGHVRIYKALKSRKGGAGAQIGIVKNIFPFDPYNRWNPMDWMVTRILDNVFNNVALEFLSSGSYNYSIPTMAKVEYENPDAVGTLDFIGMNNYSHQRINSHLNPNQFFTIEFYPHEPMTDMNYPIYPEAIYRSIKRVSELGVPIFITENGIADAKDDKRALYIDRYIRAVARSIQEGFDVRGYFYWSLMDNFEWSEGYDMKFGLYKVNFQTQERRLRDGSRRFIDIVNASKDE